jgi:hypothetical protein
MTALGDNSHFFAKPHRRQELAAALASLGSVQTVEHPALPEPMLLVTPADGGALSVEFRDDAPDADEPRLGAWLELRDSNPARLFETLLASGFRRVEHPAHEHYVMAPGGQVFAIAASD